MRTMISRWFLFGLLLGWALTHATVFGQQSAGKTASALEKLRANLDKNITIDYNGQSLTDVLNHFRDKTGLAINIDQAALMQGVPVPDGNIGQVTLKATNEKASQVLRKLLNAHQLCYILFEDSVLVTTEDMAAMRQMRQRVSVDLEDVPFSKAVRNLAKNHGLNLVIDPKVMKQSEAPVSLQLENAGIETAVRLLAELANLKAVRMGNVMFVTTEEKAKKIREEELQQLDNPLNPNLPLTPPNIRGAFGGVVVVPPAAPAIPQAIPNVVPPLRVVYPPPTAPSTDDVKPAPKGAPKAIPPLPADPSPAPPPNLERPAAPRVPALPAKN
jgi:type II secretory pathway component GspD/PulD (secretin)